MLLKPVQLWAEMVVTVHTPSSVTEVSCPRKGMIRQRALWKLKGPEDLIGIGCLLTLHSKLENRLFLKGYLRGVCHTSQHTSIWMRIIMHTHRIIR